MLVLTRKANEEILIGDNIKITLVRVKGGSVRIGIDAPREVRVVRGELKSGELKSGELKNSDAKAALNRNAGADADSVAIDGLAEVFAYPQDQTFARKAKSRNARPASTPAQTSRVGCHVVDQSDAIKAAAMAAGTETEVFVGTVSRNGDGAKLRRAPLSGFVAAS
jgi:carbon storage regulator CsrA